MSRLCLSSDPDCSGIAPCDACEKAIWERVLPRAMVAGGFNGSIQVSQRFFEGFKEAHEVLKVSIMDEMIRARLTEKEKEKPTVALKEQVEQKEEEKKEEEKKDEPAPLAEHEIAAMGQIEDFVEDEEQGESTEESLPPIHPKDARAMVRLARRLKKNRADQRKEKKEDTHGKEQAGSSTRVE